MQNENKRDIKLLDSKDVKVEVKKIQDDFKPPFAQPQDIQRSGTFFVKNSFIKQLQKELASLKDDLSKNKIMPQDSDEDEDKKNDPEVQLRLTVKRSLDQQMERRKSMLKQLEEKHWPLDAANQFLSYTKMEYERN